MIRVLLALGLFIGVADAKPSPGPFAQGKTRISISGGSAGQFGNRYIVIGGGVGYYVADGLQLGLDAAFYLGGEPSITTVSPEVRYVVWQLGAVKPYVGAFFKRQFIGDVDGVEIDDIDSAGGRAGIFYVTGRTYVGVGVAYEQILDCDEAVYETCDEIFPEFGIALSF